MSSQRLSKAAVALGGFLIFVGVLMIGVFALTLTRDVDALEGILESIDHRTLFLGVLLAIGVLNVVSGIILRRR